MAFSQDRLMLPWTAEQKESRQFLSILLVLLALFLVLAIWIPSVNLPEPDRETLEKLPPQLAKLVVKKELPKPKPPEPPKKDEKKDEPKKEEKPKDIEPKPKAAKPKAVVAPVKEKEPSEKAIKKAREVAQKTGLLALQNDLAELQSAVDLSALKAPSKTSRSEKTIAAKATSISSSEALVSSGGISTDDLSAPAETVQLTSREITSLDETNDEQALALAEAEAAARAHIRSDDSVRLAIEGLKQVLYKLYNRELRKDPFLEGVVLFDVVIEPDGSVSSCEIVSSELNNSALEKKFVNRIRLYNFGAEDVNQLNKKISINFIPQ